MSINQSSSKLESLSVRDLMAVGALAQELHFGKAADQIGIRQPSLSASIRKVEDAVGFAIFERSSRTCRVSSRGVGFVRMVQQVLDRFDEFERSLGAHEPRLTGHFRIGAIPTLGPPFFRAFLSEIGKSFPGLELSISEATTAQLLRLLKEGEIDAAFLMPVPGMAGTIARPILQEELFVAAHRDHRLAVRTSVGAEDLHPEEMVLLEDGHCLTDHILSLCGPIHARQGPMHAGGMEILKLMVALKRSYTVLPQCALGHLGADLEVIPFRKPGPNRTIALVWLKRNRLHEELALLATWLSEHFSTTRPESG